MWQDASALKPVHMGMATTRAHIPCLLEPALLLANGMRPVQATCQLCEIEALSTA